MQLPSLSFIPITVTKVAAPAVLWADGDGISPAAACDNAYCLPEPDDAPAAFGSAVRTYLVDKYGGTGAGTAGGSGRCGVFGDLQVKGIGRTALVTQRHDPFHSNGMVGMEEAAREIIWSQIAQSALPYGAVATPGALLTGTTFTVQQPDGSLERRPRVLLLREWALRPAHYMRNIYFKDPAQAGPGADAERSAAALATIHDAFEQLFPECAGLDHVAALNTGLRAMAERFAAQVATSFAKRIYHGGLSPSNIALDGKFIDFGTMTTVPAYRRRAIQPLSPDFWTEQVALKNTVTDLRFYIDKYVAPAPGGDLIGAARLEAIFVQALCKKQQVELLKLAGVSEDAIAHFGQARAGALQRCMTAIIRRRNSEPFVTWTAGAGGARCAARRGPYDLSRLIARASLLTLAGGSHQYLRTALDDAALADELAHYLRELIDVALTYSPAPPAQAKMTLVRDALRRNACVEFLTDTFLNPQLSGLKSSPGALASHIGKVVAHAREIFANIDLPAESPTRATGLSFEHWLYRNLPYTGGAIGAQNHDLARDIWNSVQ